MNFIRGQDTPYFSWQIHWFQIMISGPLSYRDFREMGPWGPFHEAPGNYRARWAVLFSILEGVSKGLKIVQ